MAWEDAVLVGEERQTAERCSSCSCPLFCQARHGYREPTHGSRQALRFVRQHITPAPHSTRPATLRCVQCVWLTTPKCFLNTTIRCMCMKHAHSQPFIVASLHDLRTQASGGRLCSSSIDPPSSGTRASHLAVHRTGNTALFSRAQALACEICASSLCSMPILLF